MTPIYASGKSKTDFTPAPTGLQQSVCCDIVNNGWQLVTYKNQQSYKLKVTLAWQIAKIEPKSGKPFLVTSRYTNSLFRQAWLRQHLDSWRGKKFTEEELKGFDLEKLLGVNCQLLIVHNESDDGNIWANVQTIVPWEGGDELKVRDYVRKKDRDDWEEPNPNPPTLPGSIPPTESNEPEYDDDGTMLPF